MLNYMRMMKNLVIIFILIAINVDATIKSPNDLLKLYLNHHAYRWKNIYARITQGRVAIARSIDSLDDNLSYVVEINGFPTDELRACGHFQGSLIEHQSDVSFIQKHLKALLDNYSPPLLLFKTLDRWASDEFHKELANNGYKNVERMPIMVLRRQADLIVEPRFEKLPETMHVLQITSLSQLDKFNESRPAAMRHILEGFDEAGINHPMMKFWYLLDGDDCISTAQIEVIEGIGCIDMVWTDEKFRAMGLASYLVTHMIQQAYLAYPELETIFLESTPMAVRLYERLGFQTISFTNTYEFETSFISCMRTETDNSELINDILGSFK